MSRATRSLCAGLALGTGMIAACGSDAVDAKATYADGGSSSNDASTTRADASGGSSGTDASPAPGDSTGVLAISADTFLSSVGVCTHVGQGVDDATRSATALAFAGFREIRDDGNPGHVADWIAMHQTAGVRLSYLTGSDVEATIASAKTLQAAGALLAVEGPNEPNNFHFTYEGVQQTGDDFVPVAHLQRDLYAAVKAAPELASVPVFHSSEAGGSEPTNVGLQFLTIPEGAGTDMPDGTKYADFANVHNYVCGHQSRYLDNTAWMASDPTLNDDWDGMYVEYGHTWNKGFSGYSNDELLTLPRVTTETGWTTDGNGSITQEQQGRLFLNLYLSAFKRGFSYTFVYMLRDDDGQGHWGFFDTGYQPKISGTYLHNLTTVLADSAGGATGKLDYALVGATDTVHDLLLQKHDGTFALVVWDEKLEGGTDSVTVDLKRARSAVTVYDPTVGTEPTSTLHDVTSVPLELSDHPVVITL